ncbi:MAG: putative ABC transport system ATP-binding protein [Candidatus Berkelbacteria bacterium Licking1014_7]|uniref:Putative ABC transport system ATP-binding protein n=1 Tax=Candidatus Berkelbacteria bacterium Licking1014_7 TaxID=2017147 RepID=A0A554LKE7_9BACT|nr:MAG: putative ABC transport system ATP-binding protein [Candidatus Berkelbacteria bacterium Licking1014_7]
MKIPNVISLQNISKNYQLGENKLEILKNINLEIGKGEFIVIKGPSGSGKSTLLNIIGLLDKPSSGKYFLENKIIDRKTNTNVLAKLRCEKIGMVFQTFNLIPRMSAKANVALPMIYNKTKKIKSRAEQLLKTVGLLERAKHMPSMLSGGEKQRVAIARALSNNPDIILADEPTGNLDSKTGEQILRILQSLNKQGKTLIVVTHNQSIAKQAQRIIEIKDGRIK